MLLFKPCKPKDATLVAPLIYSSGPDAFDYVFKTKKYTAQDFLRYAFKSKGGEFSFENHYKVVKDDTILGVGAFFSYQRAKKFTTADALKIIRLYKFTALGVMLRGLKVERMIKPPKEGEITIGHLGIAPSHQGKGFGTQLIHYLKEKAKPKPSDSFVLDVSELNTNAKNLYERMGFKITQFNPSNLSNRKVKVPNHFRMELA